MSGIVSLDCRQAGEPESLLSGSLARSLGLQLKFLLRICIAQLLKTGPPDDVNQVNDTC